MQFIEKPGFIAILVLALWLIAGMAPPAICAEEAAHCEKTREDLFSLSFPSEKDGWACGRYGTILHSSDGGRTWSPQVSGTDMTLSSICFTDNRNGWAVGAQGTILHTDDGGLSWEKQKSPVEYFHMRVLFLSPSVGFIASEHAHILSTEDGGKTWTIRSQDEDFILKSISFSDLLHGWAVGEFGCIYSTTDGGKQWEKQAGVYEIDQETGDLKGDNFLFDVLAIDSKTVWAVGIQGMVKESEDGGKTWKRVDIGAGEAPLFCIAHDGAATLMIGGKGICMISKDRGKTWKRADFSPSITYCWIHYIARLGAAGLGAACGEAGRIYRRSEADIWNRVAY